MTMGDGMKIRASDILNEKLSSIQTRIPIRLSTKDNFAKLLAQATDKSLTNVTKSTARTATFINQDSTNNIQRKLYIENVVDDVSQKYNISPSLIKAIIKTESNFNPNALSSAGAQGLMQLMPGTANTLGVQDPWDVTENIEGGVKYFNEQLNNFNGDVSLALAAYNAGPNSVKKYGGIPPYEETQNYVKKVFRYLNEYNK